MDIAIKKKNSKINEIIKLIQLLTDTSTHSVANPAAVSIENRIDRYSNHKRWETKKKKKWIINANWLIHFKFESRLDSRF